MDNQNNITFDGEIEKQKLEELNKLQTVVRATDRTLFKATTIFPFNLFPDEIIIEENRVDIIYGLFFFSKKVVSAPIANINSASASVDLFFGTLKIEIEGNNENPRKVSFLSATDAMKARRFINGLVMCHKQQVDLSKLDLEYVKKKVEEIGATT